jgi:saccharopine dehydrogenase (NAD+, L-lysine-forming)
MATIQRPPRKPEIWLRCETKQFEKRAALAPSAAEKLIKAGYEIYVERDKQRIFHDDEYEKVGCKVVLHNAWPTIAAHIPILGLKELPPNRQSLYHMHIMFGHCYKGQAGWVEDLERFRVGGGMLYDLEFLTDENGRRIAAFGFHAGFAGAAAGALAYAAQKKGETLGELEPYENEGKMIEDVKKKLEEAGGAENVKALVIGALGRCGKGAVDLFQKAGLKDENILKWDLDETAKGGPFQEILDVDIFVNCIYLQQKIPNFVAPESIKAAGPSRRLSVVVDVSCDTTNPFNPIPIYNVNTTFDKPTVDVEVGEGNPPMVVVSIDHLPTLLPRESSEQFSNDLVPALLQWKDRDTARVWTEAKALFEEKLAEAAKVKEANTASEETSA